MLIRNQAEYNLYIGLELVGTLRWQDDWHGKEHRHAFWEILYIAQGVCDAFIGKDITLHLKAGQAMLVQPMECHWSKMVYGKATMIYIGFQCEVEQGAWIDRLPRGRFILEHVKDAEPFISVMQKMAADTDIKSYSAQILQGLVPIVQWMKQAATLDGGAAASSRELLCMKAVKYIRCNMERFVSVEEIAASLYVTPHYLGTTFASCMGTTLLKYQQSLKLDQASALIRAGSMTLSEISSSLGFSSLQYFSKCFKSYFGYPPSQQKKQKQG